jgi:hypothetical protein
VGRDDGLLPVGATAGRRRPVSHGRTHARQTAHDPDPPGFSRPGRLTFTVDGAPTEVLQHPAGGGDRVDMNTFCYNSWDSGQVKKLVAEIKKAMEGK